MMKKGNKINLNLLLVLICILLCVGMICSSVIIPKQLAKNNKTDSNQDENNQYSFYGDAFYATIKKISEYNGITSILVTGLEVNDINHRGAFHFAVNPDTQLSWRGTEIKLSDLKVGQNISITNIGGVQESSPAGLTKVIRVTVLDDQL